MLTTLQTFCIYYNQLIEAHNINVFIAKTIFCSVFINEVAPTILSKQSFMAFLGKLIYEVASFQEFSTIIFDSCYFEIFK